MQTALASLLHSRKFWIANVAVAITTYLLVTHQVGAKDFGQVCGGIYSALMVSIAIEDHGAKSATVTNNITQAPLEKTTKQS